MPVEQQSQVLSAGGAHEEEQGWTLEAPEAQGEVLRSQIQVGGDGGGRGAVAAPVQLVEGVADGCLRLEAG